jgi:hypothetical protein
MISQVEITKANFYNKVLEALELSVNDYDGTIEYIENGFVKKLKFQNKDFVSLYKNRMSYRANDITIIPNCSFKSYSFHSIREHISYLIYSKTFKIINILLEYWKKNNNYKEELNQLISKFNEIYENNLDQITNERLSEKLVQIKSIIEKNNAFNFIVKFNCMIDFDKFDDEYIAEKGFNKKYSYDFDPIFVYKQHNIYAIYPLYELLKNTKEKKIFGINFEEQEIEVLKIILEFIFDNMDEKYKYPNEIYREKKLVLMKNTSFENEGFRLLKKYQKIANKINEIFTQLEDSNTKTEIVNINLTEEDFSFYLKNIDMTYCSSWDGKDEIPLKEYITHSNIGILNKELNEKSIVDNTISKKTNYKERKPKNFNYTYHRNSGNNFPSSSNVFMKLDSSNLISKPILLDETLESFNTYVPLEERLRHTYFLSRSGSGKTLALEYFFHQDIQNRQSSKIFFDIMGKSTKKIMQFVDKKDLLLLDLTLKEGFTFKLNPFNLKKRKNKEISKKDILFRTKVIINALEKVLGIEWSPNMKVILVPCIATLLRKGDSDFFELQRFMDDKNNKDLVFSGSLSPNKGYSNFFKTQFNNEKFDVTKDAIATKIQALINEDETFLNMVIGEDTIDLEDAINTKAKTIIIKIPKEANFLARFIVEMIQEIVKKRVVDYSENEIIDTHVYFDEFQNYVTETFEEILAESRNYKLYVTFAHQTLKQIGDKLEDMVLSCTNIKIVGQNSHNNFNKMSKEIQVHIKQLEALKQGEFFLKVGANEAIKIKTTDKFINMEIDEEKHQEHIAYQLEHYYTKTEDENIIEAVVDDSKILAPTKSF